MQTISVLIGLVCAALLVPGMIPLLGWTLWATLLGSVVGIIFGAFPQRKIGLTSMWPWLSWPSSVSCWAVD